jgi:predicted kinase/predicted DNA-binding transcriptional regulator YafY
MSSPLVCHFLIGPPGSGKSTFAAQLAQLGDVKIVSTDQIRATLYGDASIQGEWSRIEQEVLSQIKSAIASHQSVIYDATNAQRVWRMNLLMQLQDDTLAYSGKESKTSIHDSPLTSKGWGGEDVLWMAWHLTTPLETCKAWNQQRERRVIDEVIERMFKFLQNFPPLAAEGFAAVHSVKPTETGFNLVEIQQKINRLSRSLTNRTNRTQHGKVTLHRYSRLLDFDRLLHLMALIIRYPGIGGLHSTAPMLLEKILGTVPDFATPVEEVCALMGKLKGNIYADVDAIAVDLQWLEQQGLIGTDNLDAEIEVEVGVGEEDNSLPFNKPVAPVGITPLSPPLASGETGSLPLVRDKMGNEQSSNITTPDSRFPTPFFNHAYSDIEPFKRLMKTIRLILHHPFLPDGGRGSLRTLVDTLKDHHIVEGDGWDTVRKDIEKVLKPYQILPEFSLRQGYFAGTGILSSQELRQVFGVLQSQAQSLDDPVALSVYQMFRERMINSKLDGEEIYPVRAIANRCMIDVKSLPASALSKNLEKLETAIAQGELLELSRLPGSAKYRGYEERFFKVWPLQIVFYNQAWYLAFECEFDQLFQFGRLDRLFMGWSQGQRRERKFQEKSLKKLQKLQEASAGLFLGHSASDQRLFLSRNQGERSQVEVTVELWCNEQSFRFISEGTKRFPRKQMKMSPPGGRGSRSKSLFSLPQTGDLDFPHRLKLILPRWSLEDVDLWRWIVGFGGNVKVIQPDDLVHRVKGIGEGICRLY